MRLDMSSFGLILAAVLLGTLGQVLFKAGTQGARLSFDLSLIRILFTPYILGGLTAYGLSTVFFLKVLSQEALSYAYPMISLTYPLVLILSLVLFKEQIPLWRWLGVFLIMLGVYLVAKRV